MKRVVPPFLRNKLRNQHGHPVIQLLGLMLDRVDKFGQRLNDAPVLRIDGHQADIGLPLLPFFFKLLLRFLIKGHVYRDNLVWL
ncbi:hypothetical protein D1872_326900 [compost metagenome]